MTVALRHLSTGEQVPDQEQLTVDINARNVEFDVYTKLNKLKKQGKFSSWSVFFKYLVNNKSLSATFIDEIEKRLVELETVKKSKEATP